mgnify:CR=1 FL=1
MWELFTRGGVPYPGIDDRELVNYVRNGGRLSRPQHSPVEV